MQPRPETGIWFAPLARKWIVEYKGKIIAQCDTETEAQLTLTEYEEFMHE
jgi:hypothetical protein